LQCPAQGQIELTAQLTDQFQGLATGEHKVPAALRIEGEGLSLSLLARIEIEIPEIQLDTTSVYLILDHRSALPHHTLRLQNRGRQNWHGTAKSTLRWLEISPSDITCPAGGETEIDVTLSPEVTSIFKKPRMVRVDDGIRIEGRGQPIDVSVQLEIKPLTAAPSPTPVTPQPRPAPVSPPSPVVPPPSAVLTVDFGTVSDWSGPMPTREIRLANSQPQVMDGTARSTLPWLEVTPPSFSCPPGQEVVLQATLTEFAKGLRPKEYEVADGVVIESGGKKHLVRARLVVQKISPVRTWGQPQPEATHPSSQPVVSPPQTALTVDFGMVTDWSGPMPTREIRLVNSQAQVMRGTARSTLPWLEVTPSSFTCPPGQEVVLTATLTDFAKGLRPKEYEVADGVIIESGGKKHLVSARLVIGRISPVRTWVQPQPEAKPSPSPKPGDRRTTVPKPSATLEGLFVDFGTVTDWSDPLPTQEIRLTSSQPQAMNGLVRSTVPWLKVAPTNFSCAAGQDAVLKAELTESAKRLRSREYDVSDGAVIECGGEKYPIHVRLVVATGLHPWGMRTILPPREVEAAEPAKPEKKPKARSTKATTSAKQAKKLPEALVVEPDSIDMGSVSDWSGSLPSQEIQLSNGLGTDWIGTVKSTVPWLAVAPTEITCPAGASVSLRVRLTKRGSRLRARTYSAGDALVFEGNGQTLKVGAQMTVE